MTTSIRTTLTRLHQEDTGAQAIEYAALAGGGATIITIVIELLRSERVQEAMGSFLSGMFDTFASSLGSMF